MVQELWQQKFIGDPRDKNMQKMNLKIKFRELLDLLHQLF